MIRSKYFWTGAILLTAIPFLVLDIPKHYVDWHRDVRDQMIYLTYNFYPYTVQQKAVILDHIFASNRALMALMYVKSFLALVLLFLSVYYFRRYSKSEKPFFGKAILICIFLIAAGSAIKIFSWTTFAGNKDIRLLTISPSDTTLNNIYNNNFRGKVVYVDFWGTTCGPCLEEFQNFTKPLKEKYRYRKDIAYLYVCGGSKLIWKQQLQKFDIEGWHIFLDAAAYRNLYKNAVKGSKNTMVEMPRYLVMDKQGKIADPDAPRPSQTDLISSVLDKYLAVQ
ncbi:redoxin family protein [Mucilaginibacter sp.]|uniref:redoxin family protein n=1 Tax=Mucilaginibacter sp. TaxID=1882438 RepID=UPI00283D5CAA|nr:redoxin family protein [Mucilaginibacter sp.]MDR3696532.1 redoxin family protein [Mucilaginibacter sp.]